MQNTIENVFGAHREAFEHTLDGNDIGQSMQMQMFKGAVKSYTNTEFVGMNQRLRSKLGYMINTLKETGSISHMNIKKELVEGYNETLLDAFNTMKPFVPKQHLVLYRQINENNSNKLIKNGHLEDTGFTSATIDPMVAINYRHMNADKKGKIFRLHLLPNVEYKLIAIEKYSALPEEKEILFAPGVKYYLTPNTSSSTLQLDNVPIYDCIIVPNEPRYTKLLDNQRNGWMEKWSHIILRENLSIFGRQNKISSLYENNNEDDPEYVRLKNLIDFINEMEYIIHKHISKGGDFTDLNDEINTVIQTLIVDNIYIDQIKKITNWSPSDIKIYQDWNKVLTTLQKGGGQGAAAADVLQDLDALLRELSPMAPISGGVKKELLKTRQLLSK